jgi:hypothetical protein
MLSHELITLHCSFIMIEATLWLIHSSNSCSSTHGFCLLRLLEGVFNSRQVAAPLAELACASRIGCLTQVLWQLQVQFCSTPANAHLCRHLACRPVKLAQPLHVPFSSSSSSVHSDLSESTLHM